MSVGSCLLWSVCFEGVALSSVFAVLGLTIINFNYSQMRMSFQALTLLSSYVCRVGGGRSAVVCYASSVWLLVVALRGWVSVVVVVCLERMAVSSLFALVFRGLMASMSARSYVS